MSHMTKIEGAPDRDEIRDGMAFYPNTGPFATTCGDCTHRGYYRSSEKYNEKTGEWYTHRRKVSGCAMFQKMSGRHGGVVDPLWPSCKYFERPPEKPAQ